MNRYSSACPNEMQVKFIVLLNAAVSLFEIQHGYCLGRISLLSHR